MFLLIFISDLSLVLALGTLAVDAAQRAWVEFTVVADLVHVACSVAAEDNVSTVETSDCF
jgi:hypothetical protein